MVHRKGLVTAAACAALACAGFVQAGQDTTPSNDGNLQRPLFLDAAATGPATTEAPPAAAAATLPPLMYGLDKIGVKMPLGITVGGFIDGAYNLNLQNGSFRGGFGSLGGRFQDNFSNRAKLDQASFIIDRPIADISKLDFGAHFEVAYGRDTDFYHSSRIYDNPAVFGDPSGTYYGGITQPENQFDITQAYVDISVPVGTGLRIRAGKIVTLLGYESINPTVNPFYSHSFEFTYAIPLTQTGVLAHYVFNADFTLDAGMTRGWSQSLRDNNGDPDFLGQLIWTPQASDYLKSHTFTVKAALSEGPQSSHDNSDWWTVIDLITSIQLTGDGKADGSLLLAGNLDYGDAPHGTGTGSAEWFGLAGYGSYVINNMFTLNARAEFYNDANGFTLAGYGSPILAGTPSGTVNLWETTLGVTIHPFPTNDIGSNLVIRPEARIDYAGKAFFPGSNPHFQASFGMDVYFIF